MKQHHLPSLAVILLLSLNACSDAHRYPEPVIINLMPGAEQNRTTTRNLRTIAIDPKQPENATPTSPAGTRSIYKPNLAPTPTSSKQLNSYVEENIPIMPSRGRGYRPS